MLISLLIFLLISNAVTFKRDKSILFSRIFLLISNAVTFKRHKSILFFRIVMTGLLFASFLALNNLFTKSGVITINSTISSTISVLTFLYVYIYTQGEWFNIVRILIFLYLY